MLNRRSMDGRQSAVSPCIITYQVTKRSGVDITFGNKALGRNLNQDRRLTRAYGARMAKKIKSRLAVLSNAPTLSEVPTSKPDRRHQLKGDRSGQYAVDLIHPHRLIFEPNHEPLPRRADGGIDTDQVTAIRIIEVTDYH